jgi:hypothetical protein
MSKEAKNKMIMILSVILVIAVIYFMFFHKKSSPAVVTPPVAPAESGYRSSSKGGLGSFFASLFGGTQVAKYHCDWKDPRNGHITSYDGPCNTQKANQGWVTHFD